jgi:hypothetical protein
MSIDRTDIIEVVTVENQNKELYTMFVNPILKG